MGLRINQNIAALVAARALQSKQKALANSIEKLSSGQRINSGADDPAGLIISENLRTQNDSLDRNIQNNQNKVNQLRTEDAKLGETFDQLRAIRDQTLQALNTGAADPASRAANQTSARSSADSVSRTLRGVDTTDNGVDSSGLAAIGRSLEDIDLSTSAGAQKALDTVDSAIEELSTYRGNLGAHQTNNLEADIRRQSVEAENLRASESAIRDTDFAETTVDFVRNRVLLEANVAALVQAKKIVSVGAPAYQVLWRRIRQIWDPRPPGHCIKKTIILASNPLVGGWLRFF